MGVHFVVDGSNLEWRLESGALLRCWKLFEGVTHLTDNARKPGMHHYEGAAGAERLVSLAYADGEVRDFTGERGAEVMWQRRVADGYYFNARIEGWWDCGFWHPIINSSAWRLMMRTRQCERCTNLAIIGNVANIKCAVCP